MIRRRLVIPCLALAAVLAVYGCDGDDAGDGSPQAETQDAAAALSLGDWADEICALAVEAADTLDVPNPEDPGTLTLAERKQRAADVLAPRARALGETAGKIGDLEPPEAAADFNGVVETTMTAVSSAWLDLVDAAAAAQSTGEMDAANEVWIQAQDVADADVIAAYASLSAEAKDALSRPAGCGILNEVRS